MPNSISAVLRFAGFIRRLYEQIISCRAAEPSHLRPWQELHGSLAAITDDGQLRRPQNQHRLLPRTFIQGCAALRVGPQELLHVAHQIFQDACGRPLPIAEEQHAQHLQAQGGAGDMFSQVHARGNAHANVVPMAKRSDAPALHKVTEAVRNVAERRLQPLQLPVPPRAPFDELRASSVLARPVRAGTLCAGGAGKHHRRKRPVDSGSRPPSREDRERARRSAALELETRLRGGRRRAGHARWRLAHRLSPLQKGFHHL